MTVNATQMISNRRLKAKAALEKKGFDLPDRPRYDIPKLPLRLTEETDDNLMRLLVKFTRYQDHISGELAMVEIDEQAAETKLELAKNQYLADHWTGPSNDRVTVQKAEATLDTEVVKLTDAYAVLKAKRKLFVIMVDSMSRNAAVVSREITRRVGRADHERRSDRWGGG